MYSSTIFFKIYFFIKSKFKGEDDAFNYLGKELHAL